MDEKKLSRVRALLAKAESSSFPEEAEALSAKAQELMTRHALDRERISLSTSCLLIECVQANVRSQARLDPLWTRVLPPAEPPPAGARRPLITLESRGVRIEVGRFVNEAKRRQVARELRQALRQVSALH